MCLVESRLSAVLVLLGLFSFKMSVTIVVKHIKSLTYLPTQMRFPIGQEHVTCGMSKQSNSLCSTKLTNSQGKQTTCTFDLHAIRPYALKPCGKLVSSCIKCITFFYHGHTICCVFELGSITKYVMTTGPAGTVSFVPLDPLSMFPLAFASGNNA